MKDLFEAVGFLQRSGPAEIARLAKSSRETLDAALRLEVVFRRGASAENGLPRRSSEHESAALGLSAEVGGRDGAKGYGYSGIEIGHAALKPVKLMQAIRNGFKAAHERARLNAKRNAELRRQYGAGAAPGAGIPLPAAQADIAACYARDPRLVTNAEIAALALEASRAMAQLGHEVVFNTVSAFTELRHELFIGSEGTLIFQGFAVSQGDCYVVAQSGSGYQECHDTIGQQRGLECLAEGWPEHPASNPDLMSFALEMGREARTVAAAPPLKAPDGEVVVVTDPHFNALIAHEIVGHPSEADRALKMEAGYAGRSWLLRSLSDNEIGRRIGSPMLSACSDPALHAYGHYDYDHEGTPGRRVMHIDRGEFSGFLNSRATAALLGVEPNGSVRASQVQYAPLIRMSNTFFMAGDSPPEKLIGEVEHGYYVCGNRIPSIAESRESFRISARRIYEIDHGQLGRLFRAGSLMGGSKHFFMHVDGVGNDLRLIAIPNCGKGQPMQVKRMSNGGPTLRSRAWLGGE
ncbi:MAG TPA: TldD/PmbA family protein [Candidatus Binataceae bacterium]